MDFVPVVAVAGHELRDPLNVFHLTRQLLYRISERPGGDIRGILKKLKLQLDRIISLVDRLLDVGRIRSGKFKLELENFNPGDLVKEIVDRFVDLHPDVPLTLRIEAEAIGLWGRLRLDQAVSNIISNAIKYGLRKPIEVSVGTGASVAFVAVKDQGIGLAPDDLERIFDRFERAVPLSRVQGLGLGLWIAGRVVEARGGVISAEGQPGQGALFTVRLPLTQASLFGAGRSAVDSHTILIVEDEQESRESLTELLELEGFNVVTATNGLEAWEYLHTSHQPCLIVLDVTMPVMDGRQFRQLQLKDDELAKIPTIVVSALGASATADLAALKAFRKPVNFAALISVLRDNCGRRDPDAN